MKSLFLKIFLSFWLVQALIVALVVIATVVYRPQTESPFWDYIKSHIAEQLVQAYEGGGSVGLANRIDQFSGTKAASVSFRRTGARIVRPDRGAMGATFDPWAGSAGQGLVFSLLRASFRETGDFDR